MEPAILLFCGVSECVVQPLMIGRHLLVQNPSLERLWLSQMEEMDSIFLFDVSRVHIRSADIARMESKVEIYYAERSKPEKGTRISKVENGV